jgi:cellulose synthase/poly-beta-1,6-N-acetylglucosamine synthase-like glycosyltransferase
MSSLLPFVSICLLTYKRAQVLPQSLDSLLAQTHGDFELIINDDCSPDDTERVAREYEKRDSRVRYYRNARNLRYADNQNAALSRAHSDYVAIVHDGDVYRGDLIEQWTRALMAYPTAALVFNTVETMDREGRIIDIYRHTYPPLISGSELLTEMLLRPDSPIFGIVMIRKSCVKVVGPFDTTLPTLADVDMWMRLLARFDAAYVAEPLLQIAAREANHHNRVGNWGVLAEHEQIYRLNLARAVPGTQAATPAFRRRVSHMLWRQRLLWLACCAKQMRCRDFAAGLGFCFSRTVGRESVGQTSGREEVTIQ